MNNNYAKAYTEVLEILKYLPTEELEKIPNEQIEFYQKNCDTEYKFEFDMAKPIEEQKTLKETNAVIVLLFRDYFATDRQKEKLEKILLQNEAKHEKELHEKYNPDEIFKKETGDNLGQQVQEQTLALVEIKKDNIIKEIFKKIINFIKKFK